MRNNNKNNEKMITTGTTLAVIGAATVGVAAGSVYQKCKSSKELNDLKQTAEDFYKNKAQNREIMQQMESSNEEAEILIRKLRRQTQDDALTIHRLELEVSNKEDIISSLRKRLSDAGIDPNL